MRTVKIALLGFGVVGQGTFRALTENAESIEKRTGCRVEVARILERVRERCGACGTDPAIFTSNYDDILNDPSIEIVAEMMGGIEPAASFLLAALERGKNVVSSNKAALAARLPELRAAAAKSGVQLRFEAAVCGAIPVMGAIGDSLAANGFLSIEGIVNGTTNYILTRMGKAALSYEDALKEAQAQGFAEADPTADVEGIDAANKLCLLTEAAFGEYFAPDSIAREGITKITVNDIASAMRRGAKIKLIARVEKTEKGLELSVAPRELPLSHPLAAIDNEFNAVRIRGNMCDEIFLQGRGAGSLPTGSAVAGDILQIARALALYR